MSPRRLAMLAAAVTAVFAAGCPDFGRLPPMGTDSGNQPECLTEIFGTPPIVSFATDVQPIFTSTCAAGTCHSALAASGNQVLVEGVAWNETVGVPAMGTTGTSGMNRIEPFDPAASYMIHKIEGSHLEAPALGMGARMPLGSVQCLPMAERVTLYAWILGGALDD